MRPCESRPRPDILFLSIALHLAIWLAAPLSAVAQAPMVADVAGRVWLVDTRYRVLPERARPEFTPFVERMTATFTVDSVAAAGEGLHYYLRQGSMRVRLDTDPTGRPLGSEALQVAAPTAIAPRDPASAERSARSRHMDLNGDQPWPVASRIWDFTPLPGGALEPGVALASGAERVDTLELVADGAPGQSRSWRGVRHTRVVRDTTVAGSPAWILRDSTTLEQRDTWSVYRYSFGADERVERRLAGATVRTYALDPVLGAAVDLRSTSELSGSETWELPDGRRYVIPLRYEEETRARLLTSAEYEAERRARAEQRSAEFGGMVIVPRGQLAERVAAGEPALIDSLVAAWDASRDPTGRAALMRALSGPGVNIPGLDSILFSRALAAGDTAYAYRAATLALALSDRPLRVEVARFLIALLRDPGALIALGVDPDAPYNQLLSSFRIWPPAVYAGQPRVACVPDVCALLAGPWDDPDAEPRLRDIALLTRFASDPAAWYDTLAAHAPSGTRIAEMALRLANGGSNDTPDGAAPIPPPGAPWEAWRAWMGRVPLLNHLSSARLFEVRTGRDLGAEALERYLSADSDSARAVFGTLAADLGTGLLSPERAGTLLDGDSIDHRLGLRLAERLVRTAAPAPDPLRMELLDRALGILFEGAPLWDGTRPEREQAHAARGDDVVVVSDGLPTELLTRWSGRVRFVTADEWRARDPRAAGWAYTLGEVRQVGDFVSVSWTYREHAATAAGATPRQYAGGSEFILRRNGSGGWQVVQRGGWVT